MGDKISNWSFVNRQSLGALCRQNELNKFVLSITRIKMFFVEAVGGVAAYRALESIGKPPSTTLQIIDGRRKSGLKKRTSDALGTGFVE